MNIDSYTEMRIVQEMRHRNTPLSELKAVISAGASNHLLRRFVQEFLLMREEVREEYQKTFG